jgi:hypothetical protein
LEEEEEDILQGREDVSYVRYSSIGTEHHVHAVGAD